MISHAGLLVAARHYLCKDSSKTQVTAKKGNNLLLMIAEKYKKAFTYLVNAFFSDSYRIQTYNLLIRSQMLYSVELRSHTLLSLNNLTPERVTPIGFKPITF